MEKVIDLKKTPKKKLVELLQGLSQSDDHRIQIVSPKAFLEILNHEKSLKQN